MHTCNAAIEANDIDAYIHTYIHTTQLLKQTTTIEGKVVAWLSAILIVLSVSGLLHVFIYAHSIHVFIYALSIHVFIYAHSMHVSIYAHSMYVFVPMCAALCFHAAH